MAASFGFGAVASAIGVRGAGRGGRDPGRTVALALGGAGLAALGLVLRAEGVAGPPASIGPRTCPACRGGQPGAIFAGVGAVVTVVWLLAVRRRYAPGTGAVVALAAVLVAGLPTHLNAARMVQQGSARVERTAEPDEGDRPPVAAGPQWTATTWSPPTSTAPNRSQECSDAAA